MQGVVGAMTTINELSGGDDTPAERSVPSPRRQPGSPRKSQPANGMVSALMAELEQLRAAHEALREENTTLKVKAGGELGASEDEALLQAFLANLKSVIEMRQAGKFEQELFDTYNASMVQLSFTFALHLALALSDPL